MAVVSQGGRNVIMRLILRNDWICFAISVTHFFPTYRLLVQSAFGMEKTSARFRHWAFSMAWTALTLQGKEFTGVFLSSSHCAGLIGICRILESGEA